MLKPYNHLENAPVSHHSTEFLQYLRTENVVVHENKHWLIIENCKYHKTDTGDPKRRGKKRWHTAFLKSNQRWHILQPEHHEALTSAIVAMGYEQWELRIKRPHDRSVKRFHVHFIE